MINFEMNKQYLQTGKSRKNMLNQHEFNEAKIAL